MTELSPFAWFLLCVSAFGVGLGKGGLPGFGNFAIAVYAMVFPAKLSVGVLLPVLVCADLVAAFLYRRVPRWDIIRRLVPWTVAGVLVGFLLMGRMNDRAVQISIAALLLMMTALHFLMLWLVPKEHTLAGSRGDRIHLAGTGLLGGFSTMVANAAGPIAALYLLRNNLDKFVFVGTLAWFFMLINWVKLPLQAALGIITLESLRISLIAGSCAVVGVLLARRLLPYIPQKLFEILIWTFVVLAAVQMLLN